MRVESYLLAFGIILTTSSSEIQPTVVSSITGPEINCEKAKDVFRCDGHVCVGKESKCNGIPDCPGGEDESVQECGCLENEFRCSNSCIDIVKRCDNVPDCSEGEDEKDCKTFICPPSHTKCNNYICIPNEAVCDYKDDCGDRSDESNCTYRDCWNLEFRCKNGECIPPGDICDGHIDCKDGSDESDCTPENFVLCGDGSRMHRKYWCDGWPDCADNHADELNCSSCEKEDEFRCSNGRCISTANVCDSQCDCVAKNGTCEDEIGCEGFYTKVNGVINCVAGKTLACGTGRSRAEERCISSRYLCDNANQCFNGKYFSDEFGCGENDFHSLAPEEVFRCRDNRTLPKYLRCDYKLDCLDGDDEIGCSDAGECGEGMFRCASGQCIEEQFRCNILTDCWDKSDEIGCHDKLCDGFRCSEGGQCINMTSKCDFFIDCPDGSDEFGCNFVECTPDEFRCRNGQCVDRRFRCYNSGDPRDGCADLSHLVKCEDAVCEEGQFKCKNGPCLNESLLCNKVVDCKDSWKDEDNCTFYCSNSNCPCKDIHLNCTGFGMDEIPEVELAITWFHLGSNGLNNSLNNDTFEHLGRLVFLDLSNNSLSFLVPMMFKSLWRLNILNLQNNNLRILETKTFYGLGNLKGLYLYGNEIKIIKPWAFYGLSSLQTLDLRNLSISRIEPYAFVGLKKVSSIDLSYNRIEHLQDGTLNGLISLNKLLRYKEQFDQNHRVECFSSSDNFRNTFDR